ncbi:MAG: phosphoserine phosphatase SerB [Candidatus Bathyarchaeota archaeon]|nr:phosphoserine phosphatase SerB [Candidatus Bathyarchaeum tardum]WGM90225.1 MAG: phosphoserine phosphatase SerB [Candidatus Bathyarchaeum tardum]WNZ29689.1 MAG: phosphoserine phosphatase SerB [Candidatus Bathyarchaeota archaeon]
MSKPFVVITATGKDKPGLITEITELIAYSKGNIVDIEAFSMRGLFAIFMIVDCRCMSVSFENLREQLMVMGQKVGLDVNIESLPSVRRKTGKKLVLLTTLGKDQLGIVAKVSRFLSENNANIERIRMIAYGELNAMEILVDINDLKVPVQDFKESLSKECKLVGQDVVFQKDTVFRKPKRLIVFDVDGTLIDAEFIDELAKAAGVGGKVSEITSRAMNGELDFKQALRERVGLLKGLPVEVLDSIVENLDVTAGAEELIIALKALGYKIALISGGFTQFVEKIQEKLGIDFVYANQLVIKDGKLTGEVLEPIIDAERKAELMKEIAKKENLLMEQVVAVGDGANDRFMLQNSGLGIALYPKAVLQKVASGVITKDNLAGILYCLGAPEEKLKELVPDKKLDS